MVGSWAERASPLMAGNDWVSVLPLLEEGKLHFRKGQTPFSNTDLQSNQNCPGNSVGFQMHFSVHDLQRGSLAHL